MPRKQRKKKWIVVAATLLLMSEFFPAQASSPCLSAAAFLFGGAPSSCGGVESLKTSNRKGTCDAGSDCCHGFPQAQCDGESGGPFPV